MAGKGGGAWKVAYADFVTAMMAFFMVMWLVGQDTEKRQAVAEYFQDPWAKSRITMNRSRNPSLSPQKPGQTETDKRFNGSNPRQVPHEDPEEPQVKQPKLVTVREPERTTAGTVVTFVASADQISEEGQHRLRALVPRIVGMKNKVDIRGHVSPEMAAGGQEEEMWNLSYRRSMAVKRFLVELGIEDNRLRISVAGPHEPLVLDSPSSGKNGNARVEVFLLAETTDKYKVPMNDQQGSTH
jgi:chemotaxis protein MotB